MKFIFFNSTASIGGPTRLAKTWAEVLNSYGYQFEYHTFSKVYQDRNFYSAETEEIVANNPNIIKLIIKLYKVIATNKNAIFVFNKSLYTTPLVFLRLFFPSNKFKFIYYIHGGNSDVKYVYNKLDIIAMNFVYNKFVALVDDFDTFESINKSSKIRLLTECLLPSLRNNVISRTSIVPNPIIKVPRPFSLKRSKTIVAVGRLDPIKGFDILILAWAMLEKIYPEWQLCIFGEGVDRVRLQQIINYNLKKKDVLKGGITDVYPELLNSSIYVSSSYEEGYGLATLEAMSCKLPIVTTPTVGGKFLVKTDFNGIIIHDFNAENLYTALKQLIDNDSKREVFGNNSYDIARCYTAEKLIHKFIEVLS